MFVKIELQFHTKQNYATIRENLDIFMAPSEFVNKEYLECKEETQ